MGQVKSNYTGLRMAREASPGVLPVTPLPQVIERTELDEYGMETTSVARKPVSNRRGRRRGTPVSATAAVGLTTDVTMSALENFLEEFMYSEFANVEMAFRGLPAVATGYTIPAASASQGAKVVFSAAAATLFYAKGYVNAANNGLKPVTVDLAPAGTTITTGPGNVVETPPVYASVDLAGIRTTNDLVMTIAANGSGSLTSTAGITNWSTIGVQVGQYIHIGGANASLAVINRLTAGAVSLSGMMRVRSIVANVLTFDNATPGLRAAGAVTTTAAATAGVVDVLYSRWVRDVPVEANATDNRFAQITEHAELTLPNLMTAGATGYEYMPNLTPNELSMELPLEALATMEMTWAGTFAETITTTRKTGYATAPEPLRTEAFTTATTNYYVQSSVVGAQSDFCIKSATIGIANGASQESCQGTFGARFTNVGGFEVSIEVEALFVDPAQVDALKSNTPATIFWAIRNNDGGFVFDAPECTLGDGSRDFPADLSVTVNLTMEPAQTTTFGYSVSWSMFPVLPLIAA